MPVRVFGVAGHEDHVRRRFALAAKSFEDKVNDAVKQGAKLLAGNVRRGALYSPTVLDHVQPDKAPVPERPAGRRRACGRAPAAFRARRACDRGSRVTRLVPRV